MNMAKKKISAFCILLYVFSGILSLYTIWAVFNCYEQISLLIKQGQLATTGNEFNIVNFYITNCAQYGIFAIMLFTLGRILQFISPSTDKAHLEHTKHPVSTQVEMPIEKDNADDFDGWTTADNERKDA